MTTPSERPAEELIQSHFVRAGRQGKALEKRRDWSLFMFFRIMSEHESNESLARMLGPKNAVAPSLDYAQLSIEFTNPTLWTPFNPDPETGAPFVENTPPVQRFLNWLKAVTGSGPKELIADLESLKTKMINAEANPFVEDSPSNLWNALEIAPPARQESFATVFARIDELSKDGKPTHGLDVLKGGLARVCEYEIARGLIRAIQNVPVARSSADEARLGDAEGDQSPIEIAFTYSGLAAVGVHERVLKSFPDAFQEGMAARASRLGDVGKSAPSEWDGELGQNAIHGMLVGSFAVEGAKESDWRKLRKQIRAFNKGGLGEGAQLRLEIGRTFRAIGLEILHFELGQDPYRVGEDRDTIIPLKHRHEHFGFRDGISQPTMNLPGSGTPGSNGSWIPVAPGEIFVGANDEDSCAQSVPNHPALMKGGTYLVFRKLQQDVAGFRSFLASARPGSKQQQDRLAAQFVGRWPNGVSVVRAPTAQPDIPEDQERDLNNFRYVEEDPSGRYCPLGAHVRRTNPRDIGGKVQAKRHRILRRGMAYGGALLPEGAADDGEERGMLFVAANARIDVQFELIQSRWVNGGEFLGQAGLDKCPIIGANAGAPSDQFVSADSAVPVSGIPRFVQTRGGDYFYAPGLDGIKAIANGEISKEPTTWAPNEIGHNSVKTRDVFSPINIRKLIAKTLGVGPQEETFESIKGSEGVAEDDKTGQPMVFVGKHAQVKKVISGELSSVGVPHYLLASERMFSGERILISTDARDLALRVSMKAVLARAWEALNPYKRFGEELDNAISRAIGKTISVGRIDLVHDLAVDPVYQLVANVYGVPGPSYLTELAMSLRFGSRHVSELHPDWLKLLGGKEPSNPRLATLQVWSVLMFSDLIANFKNQEELKALGMEAASEFTLYLNQLLFRAQTKPKKKPDEARTLVEAFCAIESEFVGPAMSKSEYYRIVRLLLSELVPSALAVIPATFGSVISSLLGNRVNLSYVVPFLDHVAPQEGVTRLIYEMNRLKPSLPILQRYAVDDVVLSEEGAPKEIRIKKGNWIGALVIAANLDEEVFPKAQTFSLGTALGGEKRNLEDYLMFGSIGSDRQCFGRDKLAMFAIEKFIRAAARLPGLRRVAGDGGKEAKILGTTIGLPARFAPF